MNVSLRVDSDIKTFSLSRNQINVFVLPVPVESSELSVYSLIHT